MTEVILGLGTNLGDRVRHLRQGIRALRATPELVVTAVAPIYESDALTPPDAPAEWRLPYLNTAVAVRFGGRPDQLLRIVKAIETRLGRRPAARWAPREVDIDVLAFGAESQTGGGLTIPHPALGERPFALFPFRDLAPDWTFPSGTPQAGLTADQAARQWPGSPDRVPLRTQRSPDTITEIVGILNVTPDSFSDGRQHLDYEAAIAHGFRLVADGATVIDVGAESTRPGSAEVDEALEWDRLGRTVEGLAAARKATSPFLISVDTRHSGTAARALAAGADWINDVTGFADPEMVAVLAGSSADLVMMHSLGIPPRKSLTLAEDRDPIGQVIEWAAERMGDLTKQKIDPARVILDPGLGFGKTADQNLELVRRAWELATLGSRLLVGHSRKSFIGKWLTPGSTAATVPAARDLETAVMSGLLAARGIDYLRVHDVGVSIRAMRSVALVG